MIKAMKTAHLNVILTLLLLRAVSAQQDDEAVNNNEVAHELANFDFGDFDDDLDEILDEADAAANVEASGREREERILADGLDEYEGMEIGLEDEEEYDDDDSFLEDRDHWEDSLETEEATLEEFSFENPFDNGQGNFDEAEYDDRISSDSEFNEMLESFDDLDYDYDDIDVEDSSTSRFNTDSDFPDENVQAGDTFLKKEIQDSLTNDSDIRFNQADDAEIESRRNGVNWVAVYTIRASQCKMCQEGMTELKHYFRNRYHRLRMEQSFVKTCRAIFDGRYSHRHSHHDSSHKATDRYYGHSYQYHNHRHHDHNEHNHEDHSGQGRSRDRRHKDRRGSGHHDGSGDHHGSRHLQGSGHHHGSGDHSHHHHHDIYHEHGTRHRRRNYDHDHTYHNYYHDHYGSGYDFSGDYSGEVYSGDYSGDFDDFHHRSHHGHYGYRHGRYHGHHGKHKHHGHHSGDHSGDHSGHYSGDYSGSGHYYWHDHGPFDGHTITHHLFRTGENYLMRLCQRLMARNARKMYEMTAHMLQHKATRACYRIDRTCIHRWNNEWMTAYRYGNETGFPSSTYFDFFKARASIFQEEVFDEYSTVCQNCQAEVADMKGKYYSRRELYYKFRRDLCQITLVHNHAKRCKEQLRLNFPYTLHHLHYYKHVTPYVTCSMLNLCPAIFNDTMDYHHYHHHVTPHKHDDDHHHDHDHDHHDYDYQYYDHHGFDDHHEHHEYHGSHGHGKRGNGRSDNDLGFYFGLNGDNRQKKELLNYEIAM